jgi:hypothetical protein
MHFETNSREFVSSAWVMQFPLLLLLARAALIALLVQADGTSAPVSGAAYDEQALCLDLRAAGVPDGRSKSRGSCPFLVVEHFFEAREECVGPR